MSETIALLGAYKNVPISDIFAALDELRSFMAMKHGSNASETIKLLSICNDATKGTSSSGDRSEQNNGPSQNQQCSNVLEKLTQQFNTILSHILETVNNYLEKRTSVMNIHELNQPKYQTYFTSELLQHQDCFSQNAKFTSVLNEFQQAANFTERFINSENFTEALSYAEEVAFVLIALPNQESELRKMNVQLKVVCNPLNALGRQLQTDLAKFKEVLPSLKEILKKALDASVAMNHSALNIEKSLLFEWMPAYAQKVKHYLDGNLSKLELSENLGSFETPSSVNKQTIDADITPVVNSNNELKLLSKEFHDQIEKAKNVLLQLKITKCGDIFGNLTFEALHSMHVDRHSLNMFAKHVTVDVDNLVTNLVNLKKSLQDYQLSLQITHDFYRFVNCTLSMCKTGTQVFQSP